MHFSRKFKQAFALLLIVGMLATLCACSSKEPATVDSDLIISADDISEVARFYPVNINGTDMEVIAVKATDGTIRTAFNTCQVCFDSGRGYYQQKGDVFVCQNCGNEFHRDDVEVLRGGCNPVPIDGDSKEVTEEVISISEEFLKANTDLFSRWK